MVTTEGSTFAAARAIAPGSEMAVVSSLIGTDVFAVSRWVATQLAPRCSSQKARHAPATNTIPNARQPAIRFPIKPPHQVYVRGRARVDISLPLDEEEAARLQKYLIPNAGASGKG